VDKKLSTSEIVILVAGAVALLGSFLPWIDVEVLGESVTESAWGDSFPLLTWTGLFGAAMAIVVALRSFANVAMPDRVLGFTWPDIHLILAVFATLITISWLIAGDNKGIGFWLSLLASFGLVAGAWMMRSETQPVPPAA